MALTSGERAALWRKRQREDAAKHAAYKEKERQRYKKRKQSGELKSVKELSEREQRKKRRNWKKNQRSKREKDKVLMKGFQSQLSPPASPLGPLEFQQMSPPGSGSETKRSRGRRKKNLNRSKAYRDLLKVKIEMNKERRMKHKYKSKFYRLLNNKKDQSNSDNEVNHEVQQIMKQKAQTKTHLTHYCLLLRNMRKRYKKGQSPERQLIKKLLYREAILRKYKINMNYAKQKTGINEPRIRRSNKVPHYHTKQSILKTGIVSFFERDDNSRIKGGKKYTITRKKIKKQVRLLNDSIKHLHEKFLFETGKRISYSLFSKMKPFWVIKASEKDRETCLCKIHENPTMKVNKLFDEKILETKDLRQLIACITCDTKNKTCMYRECNQCKNWKIKTKPETENVNYGKIVDWKEWKSDVIEKEKVSDEGEISKVKHNITVKKTETGTIATLVNELQMDIARLARHDFNISHQYCQLKDLKDSCKANELILHIDFSENYLCKYKSEIQSVHFGYSKRQISIHTVMAYTHKKSKSFATMSDNTSHKVDGIWAHLYPVVKHMKRLVPEIAKLHIISDGPTSQYRNKTNFYMFSTKLYDLGFCGGTWNFMEAGHGKGAPDGIGAVIKRTADTVVNTQGQDIVKTADLIDGIRRYGTSIELIEIPDDDVTEVQKTLPAKVGPSVPDTMKLHQVVVYRKGVVSSRVLSCFCCENCQCFEPKLTTFQHQDSAYNADDLAHEVLPAVVQPAVVQHSAPAVVQQSTPALVQQSTHDGQNGLVEVDDINEALLGEYLVVEYDGLPYPGIVVAVDDETVEVSVMHKIGANRFFWPLLVDQFNYTIDKIITRLEGEPKQVTSRHKKLNDDVWRAVREKMMLDEKGNKHL